MPLLLLKELKPRAPAEENLHHPRPAHREAHFAVAVPHRYRAARSQRRYRGPLPRAEGSHFEALRQEVALRAAWAPAVHHKGRVSHHCKGTALHRAPVRSL